MRLLTRAVSQCVVVLAVLAVTSGAARGAAYNITWLDMSPTVSGASVPNGSIFFVPGIGNVTVTYSIPATISDSRMVYAPYAGGSVVVGPDTYSWTNFEYFGTILNSGPDPLVPIGCTITYTFQSQLPAGSVFVGTFGLGATTSFGGGASITTVNQNGTFFGDYDGPDPLGPTLFTGGAGTFSAQNSLTAPGGQNPHWNTELGVVRIDDAVTSITVNQSQIRGDGIGANIGFRPELVTRTSDTTWGRLKHLYR